MTATAALQVNLTDAIVGAFPELDVQQRSVAVATYRLLARGAPVSLTSIANAVEMPAEHIESMFADLPGVFFDGNGRIVGFWGLSLGDTRHRLEIEGRALFTWCAWDTLFIPLIVGADARVVSRSPGDDADVEVAVTRDGASAAGDVMVSLVRPDPVTFQSNVISAFCRHIYFFASPAAAKSWSAERDDIVLLKLDEAFALGRDVVSRVYGGAF